MFLLSPMDAESHTSAVPRIVTSASDLTLASQCEWAFLRRLDAKLGRIPPIVEERDAMNQRTSALGDVHEANVLQHYRDTYAEGVVEIDRPQSMSAEHLAQVAAETKAAFEGGADVVFQATFWDGNFVGFADFIVRQPDGSYEVQDTKLARHAKITALLQLAAYGEKLTELGVPVSPVARLILGDGSHSEHRLADIAPVYRKRRARLQRIMAERLAELSPLAWGDTRYALCGRCELCEEAVQEHRDLLLVANLSVRQRAVLNRAGIATIEQLAAAPSAIDGMSASTFEHLREQARLQLESAPDAGPAVTLFDPKALAALPDPDAGDIFFDFEGDPLYSESGAGEHREWGLDYLFGLIEPDGTFRAFWAHTFAEERQALAEFLAYVADRRRRHPNMHIYHYAPYERTHLLSLAARHGVGEDAVDTLLREHVLVDLYPIVRQSVRVGSRSYSIKKLEPLYMGDERREGDVTNAGDSITEYARLSELRAAGLAGDADAAAEAQRMLDSIADYNEYDCVSTLRLRDWLRGLALAHGIAPSPPTERDEAEIEPSPLHDRLAALAGDPLELERTPEQRALGVAAAAIDYHRREHKSFWWGHFSRLVEPIDEWADTRDCFIIDRAVLERDWHREGKQRSERRHVRVFGQWAPGSTVKEGATPYVVYAHPGPWTDPTSDPGARVAKSARLIEVGDDGSLLIEETLGKDVDPYTTMPVALTPASPPSPGTQVDAIAEWGQRIVDAADAAPGEIADALPAEPMLDLLRRVPPRTRGGRLPATGDNVADVTAALLDLDGSYLAVQGPPGTGKTYLASHVIAALVRDHQWRIGVVSQSHAVVENVLDRVVAAGLPNNLVGKAPKDGDRTEHDYTTLRKTDYLTFALDNAHTGFVVGGTAWNFSNPALVPRESLDLLVVDEAGQFSLGSTIAASVGARNLLLLGDPQQLPQVSQGTHPEPVDESALGWVSAGHDVLPTELGYFLAESRRMHGAVSAVVSALSYEGALHSHPCAGERMLEGVEPGLHVDPVAHSGNATSSPEEAARVVEIVRSHLGRPWTDPSAGIDRMPLTQADIMVVSPYNAHVAEIRDALERADLHDVRVGTVDKFQGQEAVIAIVSLAASDSSEVPRGMGFLLLKNRLNVSISRAQWAAHLVYSPELVEYLPRTPAEVAQLSAFIRLVEGE
ncbi:uncharacterized protein SAMN04489806_1478 [Paramicrobacterium humi]|uniref:AAA+ ATPase domain-containing protein n=1 Tax=Paramicrobacterium humi TaxID=640635 RepID=A0A1H4LAD4_9MICO|nr:bifunctional RecB family nuclease/DEAD/DEAH box helicase [Microbacterium humi]SEB67707.1 uncharacterized protein SAMN04489806_1478 [Microbacterium humi]